LNGVKPADARFAEPPVLKDIFRIATTEKSFQDRKDTMGRKRLFNRDSEILKRYCQGYPAKEICRHFKMTRSQLAKIIRRAAGEGYQFLTIELEPF
jgi:Mor family transcriptional regulator